MDINYLAARAAGEPVLQREETELERVRRRQVKYLMRLNLHYVQDEIK